MPLALIRELETWSALNCGYERSTLTALLSLTRYTGLIITAIVFVVGVRYREIYLLLFSLGLAADGLLNTAMRSLVRDRELVVPTCTDPYTPGETPSYQMQHAAFFVVFAVTYTGLYRPRLKLWHMLILVGFYAAVLYADNTLNYHTERSTMAGAYLGALGALVWQLVVRYGFYPLFPYILRSHPVRYFNYCDTICGAEAEYTDPGHTRDVARFHAEVPHRADGLVSYAMVEKFIAAQRW